MSEKIIREAEEKWLPTLSQHCRSLFQGSFLPSHDHVHHQRVWSNARSFLILLNQSGADIMESLPEELLISVYFHDTGLTRTCGEQHGKESRKLCEEFFRGRESLSTWPGNESGRSRTASGPLPAESQERILHAIEHHDDKSLKASVPEFRPGSQPDLLSLLSTSDDLDAFGNMGIYRYAEIYLLRGVTQNQLPARVSRNVQDRFENIKRSYGELESFIRFQEPRYLQVRDFYLRLGQAYASRGEAPSWEPVLIEIFRQFLDMRINLLSRDRLLPETEFDSEIRAWFRSLDENNQAGGKISPEV